MLRIFYMACIWHAEFEIELARLGMNFRRMSDAKVQAEHWRGQLHRLEAQRGAT